MITATEHGAFLGYTIGYDLPREERKIIIDLAARWDDPVSVRKLDNIVASHRPDAPRYLRVLKGQANYADAFRSNFIDGATAPGQHRKLIDA